MGPRMREDTGRGGFVFAGGGMGFCMREDTEGERGERGGGREEGWVSAFVFARGEGWVGMGSCSGGEGWVDTRVTGGDGFARREGWVGGSVFAGSRGQRDGAGLCSRGGRDGFTRQYRMHRLVWYEVHESMESARVREKALKKWYRAWKVRLVEEGNPRWLDLYEGIV